jgi:ubiquinone/menaquinone biosynthesis C-methylase UbiE
LEAGCGTGRIAVALAKRSFLVTAIDTVTHMLAMTRQAAIEAGVNGRIRLIQSDVHNTGFSAEQFDLALAIGVVPWSEHPERAIRELVRVVRPGRYVVLSADNLWCLPHILDPFCFPAMRPIRWKMSGALERLMIRSTRPLRYRYHSVREFDAILSHAGLEKIEGVTVGFGPFSLFNRKLLSSSAELRVNGKLQALADRGFPLIRSAGVEYVVSSRKATRLIQKED